MRHFALTFSAMFFLACATAQPDAKGTASPAPPPPAAADGAQAVTADGTVQATITMQDGTSFDRAIIIDAANEMEGVAQEYKWVAAHFPGYRMKKQSLTNQGGKPYDVLHITDSSGADHDVHFDISSFFGKH